MKTKQQQQQKTRYSDLILFLLLELELWEVSYAELVHFKRQKLLVG